MMTVSQSDQGKHLLSGAASDGATPETECQSIRQELARKMEDPNRTAWGQWLIERFSSADALFDQFELQHTDPDALANTPGARSSQDDPDELDIPDQLLLSTWIVAAYCARAKTRWKNGQQVDAWQDVMNANRWHGVVSGIFRLQIHLSRSQGAARQKLMNIFKESGSLGGAARWRKDSAKKEFAEKWAPIVQAWHSNNWNPDGDKISGDRPPSQNKLADYIHSKANKKPSHKKLEEWISEELDKLDAGRVARRKKVVSRKP